MNSRKLFALFLVFALTGSALAAQQQRLYRGSPTDGDAEANDVTAVQQHSIFIEIVVEQKPEKKQIHEFAAVVGLIKKCKRVRNVFDNAVLWFNDQFLFGEKQNDFFNVTPDSALGVNNNSTVVLDGDDEVEDGFVGENGDLDNETPPPAEPDGTPRWGDCYTPNGFAHAIGADDPFGVVNAYASNGPTGAEVTTNESGGQDGISAEDGCDYDFPQWAFITTESCTDDPQDVVKDLINLDNQCGGCIFEYQSSFFVVDPNDHNWIVDKYVYPLSVFGNLFNSGAGPDCGDDESDETEPTPFSQPTDPREDDAVFQNGQHHADRCEDNNSEPESPGNDQNKDPDNNADHENHCNDNPDTARECDGGDTSSGIFISSDQEGEQNTTLVEPLFSVHLQVNPATGMGWADKAAYEFTDTGGTNSDTSDAGGASDGGIDGMDADDASTYDGDEDDEDIRRGAIYPRKGTPNRELCEDHERSVECSIEYNFLLAVDFAAFDDKRKAGGPVQETNTSTRAEVNRTGENEIDRGCSVEHGPGAADQDDAYWQGNSHPHRPNGTPSPDNTNGSASDQPGTHCHPTVNLDIFFHGSAPYYTEENRYWDEYGIPLEWTADCEQAITQPGQDDPEDADAIEQRTPIVCDVDDDAGEYHKHSREEHIPRK